MRRKLQKNLRIHKLSWLLCLAMTLGCLAGCQFSPWNTNTQTTVQASADTSSSEMTDWQAKGCQGPYLVEWVSDGDTITVIKEGQKQRVRLIGIDTPESVHSDETKNTPEGKAVSAYVKELLTDTEVYLEYDEETYDQYGRDLAYVYMTDGTMVNELLVSLGMAETMTIRPNTRYRVEFAKLQEEAKASGAGFWGTGFFPQQKIQKPQ